MHIVGLTPRAADPDTRKWKAGGRYRKIVIQWTSRERCLGCYIWSIWNWGICCIILGRCTSKLFKSSWSSRNDLAGISTYDRDKPLGEATIWRVWKYLTSALTMMESGREDLTSAKWKKEPIGHFDIKPENSKFRGA